MRRRASSPRVRAVVVLGEILERGGRSTALLAERSRGLPAEDADLLRAITLGVLRNRAALDVEIASVSRVPLERLTGSLREILEVALFQLRYLDRVPDYAAVNEAVAHARAEGGPGAAGLVNAVLRNLLRRVPPGPGNVPAAGAGAAALSIVFSHPEFLVQRWLARFGPETTRRVLEADNRPSAMDLLVNARRTTREELAAALDSEGIATRPSRLAPFALTVVSGSPLRSPLFAAGHFAIQDIASQAVPLLLPAGALLADLAAAPGGKSFSALLHGRAHRALALDRSVTRLERVNENRSRLGIAEVMPVGADILAPPLAPGRFDRVLFDAPCSGTGTLRKNPEIRYRVSQDSIERLSRSQEAGLAAASRLLAPGGFLLYSTCSLEEEENERVVARVLASEPGLALEPMDPPEALRPFVSAGRFQILPGEENDGFTAHLIRRRPPG